MSEIYCTACKDKVTLHADATFACSCEGPINPLDGGDPIPETWEMHGGDTDVYHELRRGADVEKAYQKAALAALDIQITIPRWGRPNGETQAQFKVRFDADCKRAYRAHIQEAKNWTERRAITGPLYAEGLAMWQAGREVSEIHKLLKERGLNVGHPQDSDDHSAVRKGIERTAELIQLDRRPAKNRKRTPSF